MTKTTIYTVSTYNETPINTVEYKGESRYQADLTVMNLIRENKHGVVVAITTIENKEFDYVKTNSEIMKNF